MEKTGTESIDDKYTNLHKDDDIFVFETDPHGDDDDYDRWRDIVLEIEAESRRDEC